MPRGQQRRCQSALTGPLNAAFGEQELTGTATAHSERTRLKDPAHQKAGRLRDAYPANRRTRCGRVAFSLLALQAAWSTWAFAAGSDQLLR